ncbi:MAG TPA: ATP synthase F1 subunit gamma [Petrotogaceae bacterium]|jgi:F-type H+-transporting ATPase subunit gamma|nr:ATP synthase F1 subunit gamma [Petrotogaceae bacterium]HPA92358.1 ATP synthase F1 subunit gamma [Petrotogaceae bacterium]HPX15553.1 ATP synthase F1 subunit gamma [Petrotogaceae bacterium]HQC41249.1 ATP synthase F1 subunit gamma [Petrotogaceae bacterium]HQO11832.1 ATP synthase F1 subunit gamma [Petrotogaceae bacterium]
MGRGKLRTIKNRIDSTKSTMKITKAMEMVASARINRVNRTIEPVRTYARYAKSVLSKVKPETDNKFFKQSEGTLIFAITTDMGLCGSFNSDIVSFARNKALEHSDFKGFYVVGSKGTADFKSDSKILLSRTKLYDIPGPDSAKLVLEDILSLREKYSCGKIEVVYGEFRNALIQRPKCVQLLPIQYEGKETASYEYEPTDEKLIDEIAYLYMLSQVYTLIFETKVSEYYARRNAMKNATDNAQNLIGDLTLAYNKMRQDSITQELIEIVNGAQALKQE